MNSSAEMTEESKIQFAYTHIVLNWCTIPVTRTANNIFIKTLLNILYTSGQIMFCLSFHLANFLSA